MPPRASWKGYLKLSLVSVPVQAFTASVTGGGQVHLNQLHEKCHSRIKYQKVCPIHGEVTSDEIVSGFEYAKGQYVVVETEEIGKLRSEADKAITIDAFIKPDQLDPIYYDGRTYYLVPDTPVGQKTYAVVYRAMQDKGRYGVAQVVFSGKEQVVLIRPLDGLLTMTMLQYDHQIRKPEAFRGELSDVSVPAKELELAETLIEASTVKKFDFSQYEDLYTKRLTELIEAKVEGKEVVSPPAEEEAPVINLMDALKQSVARAKKGGEAEKKPPKKLVASKRPAQAAAARKRKSS